MYFSDVFSGGWYSRYSIGWVAFLWLCGPIAMAQLSYLDMVRDGVGGVDGLDGAEVVKVSPAGGNVYASGLIDNALAVFDRDDITGLLTFSEVHRDGVAGVDGLMGAQGIAIHDSGSFLFVAGSGEDALAVFRRDLVSGSLTFLAAYRDGVGGIDGIAGPLRVISVMADVYVTGTLDNAIAQFRLDLFTGDLAFVAVYRDGVGGVDGLTGALGISGSSDGKNVYVTGTGEDAVAAFSRNILTGTLTFMEAYRQGVGGQFGLDDPQEIEVAPGGKFVYCASFASRTLVMFRRESSGALTFITAYFDGVGGNDGLDGALGVAVKPGSRQVVVMGFNDHAVSVWERGPGGLFFAEVERDGVMGVDGLFNAVSGAWDPSGRHFYATGFGDDAIAIFSAETTLASLILAWSDGASGVTVLELVAFISGS